MRVYVCRFGDDELFGQYASAEDTEKMVCLLIKICVRI